MKIIVSSAELMRLGFAVGNAKKSGDKEKIIKAKKKLAAFEKIIRDTDCEMSLY